MVTKYVPGYGNVTAREDMFIGEGDKTKIVINDDYKEIGIITPKVEKFPDAKYIVIDTPYGKVNVSKNTYDMLGRDQIIADAKRFIEERNESIKTGKVKIANTSETASGGKLLTENTQQLPKVPFVSPMATVGVREDLGFNHKSGMLPTYIWGSIVPQSGSPLPPYGYTSYHELEIHLDNYRDICEVISDHRTSSITVWVCLWESNNMILSPMPYFDNVNGAIEYGFNTNPVLGYYTVFLYNPATGEIRQETYTDTTMSSYINFMDASSELTYLTPISTWYDETAIHQYIGMVGSTYYLPADLFSMGTVGSRSQYVDVSGTQNSGQYTTTHKDGSSVS